MAQSNTARAKIEESEEGAPASARRPEHTVRVGNVEIAIGENRPKRRRRRVLYGLSAVIALQGRAAPAKAPQREDAGRAAISHGGSCSISTSRGHRSETLAWVRIPRLTGAPFGCMVAYGEKWFSLRICCSGRITRHSENCPDSGGRNPARHYLISGGSKSSVGTRGEDTPHVIYRSPGAVTREINQWLERFEIPYKLTIKPLGDEVTGEIVAMHLKDKRSKVELAPSDVGFGIGQLLPIVVQGLVSQARILCVEQPEIHLHPRLQAHLADFFIATSLAEPQQRPLGVRRAPNQWIIETHSEALLCRLKRRIRDGSIQPDHVAVLYVRTLDDGASQIVRLRLDESGQFIDPWPDGFFEETYNELLA